MPTFMLSTSDVTNRPTLLLNLWWDKNIM